METEERKTLPRAREDFTKGMARLKPEFLVHDYIRELDPQFLNPADREKLDISADGRAEDGTKQPKLKGRNKRRKENFHRHEVKICTFLVRNEPCPYGEKCRYSHKTEDYLLQKGPDIGEKCPIFAKIGYCPYSFTCRFAKSHLEADGNTVVPEGYVNANGTAGEINGMGKELQRMLRKRKFEFVDKSLELEHEGNSVDDTTMPEEHGPTPGNAVLPSESSSRSVGSVSDEDLIKLRLSEKKQLDLRSKLYLSPLTTVGNLPFRRVCKRLGAEVTCGEMALASNLLSGQQSEWALMLRHETEDIFGVQVCGSKPDLMKNLAFLLKSEVSIDFVDLNAGCPIDLVCNGGSGCAMMGRSQRMEGVVRNMASVLNVPLTVKMRTGIQDNKNIAHELIPKVREWGASMVALHGRSRDQRYTRSADWEYIAKCAAVADPMPLFGNGDCMNFEDYYLNMENSKVAGILIARGALIKPWIFTEIREKRHWDISAQERLDIFKDYTNYGLEHWGSDTRGVENTRRFLLEWMSFTHRYIPVGILETVPQRINERPPYYHGRSDLETLLSSAHCRDWIKVTEMLLGPVPDGFVFLPKHKANAWK